MYSFHQPMPPVEDLQRIAIAARCVVLLDPDLDNHGQRPWHHQRAIWLTPCIPRVTVSRLCSASLRQIKCKYMNIRYVKQYALCRTHAPIRAAGTTELSCLWVAAAIGAVVGLAPGPSVALLVLRSHLVHMKASRVEEAQCQCKRLP